MAVPGERAHGDGQRELLLGIERYYDAVPRTAADVEAWGPLTLFVQRPGGWPYYARPALGSGPDTGFGLEDVQRVRARQRELGIPEAFEWVHDVTPGLRAAMEAAGLEVHTYPLMVLDLGLAPPGPTVVQEGVSVRLVAADEPDAVLRRMDTGARVSFGAAGTAVGPTGVEALDSADGETSAEQLAFRRERLRTGRTVTAIAEIERGVSPDGGAGGGGARVPVSVGSHQPLEGVTEIVGVATLPAFRRRGIGGAVVQALLRDALARGVATVFLTAGGDDVARVYARLGFRQIATACVAEAGES